MWYENRWGEVTYGKVIKREIVWPRSFYRIQITSEFSAEHDTGDIVNTTGFGWYEKGKDTGPVNIKHEAVRVGTDVWHENRFGIIIHGKVIRINRTWPSDRYWIEVTGDHPWPYRKGSLHPTSGIDWHAGPAPEKNAFDR